VGFVGSGETVPGTGASPGNGAADTTPEVALPTPEESRAALGALAAGAGLTRVRMVAWRDLDDPEAGGSELHAHRVAARWADAGLQVELRTSAVPGGAQYIQRDGYQVVRRFGRYGVFPAVAAEGLRTPARPGEGLVEIWNGMPFFSPLWYRGPSVVFLHHVHAEMWRMVLPGWLARIGEVVESKVAPPLYRRRTVVTLSESSRHEIAQQLSLDPDRIFVAPPGVGDQFTPGGTKSPDPLVVAVGRLVPVKRFDLLIEALVTLKRTVPRLRAVIIGEGYERPMLEALVASHRAGEWLTLPGRLGDDEVLAAYRSAWVVASTSLREGWGMTLTEAGACGTPAVATSIAGHRDAVIDGHSGLLADRVPDLAGALGDLLRDDALRTLLGKGALERAAHYRWDATARATLEALAAEARRRT
jgi:glycosyltransferase involved in cell wall biosynthesis